MSNNNVIGIQKKTKKGAVRTPSEAETCVQMLLRITETNPDCAIVIAVKDGRLRYEVSEGLRVGDAVCELERLKLKLLNSAME